MLWLSPQQTLHTICILKGSTCCCCGPQRHANVRGDTCYPIITNLKNGDTLVPAPLTAQKSRFHNLTRLASTCRVSYNLANYSTMVNQSSRLAGRELESIITMSEYLFPSAHLVGTSSSTTSTTEICKRVTRFYRPRHMFVPLEVFSNSILPCFQKMLPTLNSYLQEQRCTPKVRKSFLNGSWSRSLLMTKHPQKTPRVKTRSHLVYLYAHLPSIAYLCLRIKAIHKLHIWGAGFPLFFLCLYSRKLIKLQNGYDDMIAPAIWTNNKKMLIHHPAFQWAFEYFLENMADFSHSEIHMPGVGRLFMLPESTEPKVIFFPAAVSDPQDPKLHLVCIPKICKSLTFKIINVLHLVVFSSPRLLLVCGRVLHLPTDRRRGEKGKRWKKGGGTKRKIKIKFGNFQTVCFDKSLRAHCHSSEILWLFHLSNSSNSYPFPSFSTPVAPIYPRNFSVAN
ncbi:hypothetical protein VP01_2658g1 [Puccinia sorghi]|uniref:Uncharacterized protein n=1 Tax=Puccinia sorghi TaxID=27349 RepID=A0A0L6V420_9BASI|nr:hypothetical protein VP01_2658g1 [Puccinia sorghi]